MANGASNQPAGQASAGAGDIVTQLAGIVRGSSNLYTALQSLIVAIQAVNFPQSINGTIVADLPAAASSRGQLMYVTDGTASLSWGATVTGGHSTIYLVWSNGVNWTVVGE